MRVYVEKPREKRSSSSIQHHQHHYHIHHTVVHGSAATSSSSSSSKGYDRRSGLLRYSRLLRDSARGSASSTPSQVGTINIVDNLIDIYVLLKLMNYRFDFFLTIDYLLQMASFKKKPEYAGRPAWFGNWRLLIPSFLRSWSNAQKEEKKKKQTHGGFLGNGIKKLQVFECKFYNNLLL